MSFSLWFGGAEQPLSARTLSDENVGHQMVSFYEWQKRHDLSKPISGYFDSATAIGITPGVSKRTDIDWKKFCRDYSMFVLANGDRLALVLELDSQNCPVEKRIGLRHTLYELREKLVVFPTDEGQIHFMGQHQIGLNASTVRTFKPGMIKAPIHLVNTSSKKMIIALRAASASTHSWLSPRRYGEAWLYENGKLEHYQAENADELASRLLLIESYGVDPQAAIAKDPEALTLLAIRSLKAFEGDISAILSKGAPTEDVAGRVLYPATLPSSSGASEPRQLLPVITPQSPDELGDFTPNASLFRQCDSCYLSARCPRFEVHSNCSYEIPVTIRTKEDWKRATKAILEMQMQRVAFGYFAEQVEGTALQEKLGREMDRFFKMLTDQQALEAKDLEQIERKEGILSEIFKTKVPVAALPEGEE